MKSNIRKLTGAILITLAPLSAHAATTATTSSEVETQTTQLNTTAENKGQTQVATRIASSFTTLAGSQDNALALVRALRNGTEVTLTSTSTSTTGTGTGTTGTGTGTGTSTTSTSFTPPTGKMGWGNVFISLALAQDVLTRAGITNPTAAQLQAALVGGDVTGADGKTVTLKGVLTMRADGMGWGQIAQAMGTKLGPVVSAIKSQQGKVAALPPATTTPTATASTTKSAKGITTAAGTSGASASGKHESKGLVTASGASAGGVVSGGAGSKGNAYGKGIVTGTGAAATVAAVPGASHAGVGVVNASGAGAAGSVTTGNGGNGQGKANGKGKGPG